MKTRSIFTVASLSLWAGLAHANTIATYRIAAGDSPTSVPYVTGDFALDLTTGSVESANIVVGSGMFIVTAPFTPGQSGSFFGFQIFGYIPGTKQAYLNVILPQLPGVNQTLDICSLSEPCSQPGQPLVFSSLLSFTGNFGQYGSFTNFGYGQITPQVATTPEPSSWVLLCTAAFGLLAVAKRSGKLRDVLSV